MLSLRYNEGLSNALNAGPEQSQAPFIIQPDADDWLEATALESVLRALRGDESVGAVYSDSVVHGPDGEVSVSAGRQLSTPIELLECTSPQAPRAYRKSALLDVGGWITADAFFGRYFDDCLILARLAEKYKVQHLPQKLYHIDEQTDSLSRGKSMTPDCRLTHKQRLLDILRFDESFEHVAGRLACDSRQLCCLRSNYPFSALRVGPTALYRGLRAPHLLNPRAG